MLNSNTKEQLDWIIKNCPLRKTYYVNADSMSQVAGYLKRNSKSKWGIKTIQTSDLRARYKKFRIVRKKN